MRQLSSKPGMSSLRQNEKDRNEENEATFLAMLSQEYKNKALST